MAATMIAATRPAFESPPPASVIRVAGTVVAVAAAGPGVVSGAAEVVSGAPPVAPCVVVAWRIAPLVLVVGVVGASAVVADASLPPVTCTTGAGSSGSGWPSTVGWIQLIWPTVHFWIAGKT